MHLPRASIFELRRQQFDESPPGCFEHFEAVLKMTDACYEFDLQQALSRCDQAFQLARARDDSSGTAVCYMYQALILAGMGDSDGSDQAFEKASRLFDPKTANAFHRWHYYAALVRYELMIGEGVREIDDFLRNWMSAALETQDDVLITLCRIMVTFDVVALGGDDPRKESLATTVDHIRELGPQVGLAQIAAAFLSYIQGKIALADGDEVRATKLLLEAAEQAGKSGNAVMEGIFRFAAVNTLVDRGDWDTALPHVQRGLQIAAEP